MSQPPQVARPPDDGVRHYTLLCLVGLGMMALALFLRGLDTLAVLRGRAGEVAVGVRWRGGALGVLLSVAGLVAAQRWRVLHPAVVGEEVTWMVQPTGFGGPRGPC